MMGAGVKLMAIAASGLLCGCVAWTGAGELRSVDSSLYAGTVTARPGFVLLLFPGDPIWRDPYTVADCFMDGVGRNRKSDGTLVPTFGADPVKRVCRQYQGVDLTRVSQEQRDCFETVEADGERQFKHPWLRSEPLPACRPLIDQIDAARKRAETQ